MWTLWLNWPQQTDLSDYKYIGPVPPPSARVVISLPQSSTPTSLWSMEVVCPLRHPTLRKSLIHPTTFIIPLIVSFILVFPPYGSFIVFCVNKKIVQHYNRNSKQSLIILFAISMVRSSNKAYQGDEAVLH